VVSCESDDDDAIVVEKMSNMSEAPKLMERVRGEIRSRHYSRRTEDAYVHWIRRYIVFPDVVCEPLRRHLEVVKALHTTDLADGYGRVVLPSALERKFPNAATEWRWQFVFPAGRICRDPRFGSPSRFHLHESVVQRAVTQAGRFAELTKRVTCHTFRHSFATLARGGL
jgi:integrase